MDPVHESDLPADPTTPVPSAPFRYVPDEDLKVKHHWDKNFAGFVVVAGVRIGKCPNNLSTANAERLLNSGVTWSPKKGWHKSHPKRIYNILEGIVYRATPTLPGQSYHGFPEEPAQLPPEMKKPLLALAQQLGCLDEVKKWLKP